MKFQFANNPLNPYIYAFYIGVCLYIVFFRLKTFKRFVLFIPIFLAFSPLEYLDILWIGIFCAILYLFYCMRGFKLDKNPIYLFLALFVFISILSWLINQTPPLSFLLFLFLHTSGILYYLALRRYLNSLVNYEVFLSSFLLICVIQVIVQVTVFFHHGYLEHLFRMDIGGTVIKNPHLLGGLLIMGVMISGTRYLYKVKGSLKRTSLIFLAWMFCAANHQVYSLFVAISCLFTKRIKAKFIIPMVIMALAYPSFKMASFVFGGQISNLVRYLTEEDSGFKFLKLKTFHDTLVNLPEDIATPFLGAGPGGFASRSALIISGNYLLANIPFINPYMSPQFKKYINPRLDQIKKNPDMGGTTNFPWSSYIALLGESGYLGFMAYMGIFIYIALVGIRLSSKKYKEILKSHERAFCESMIYIVVFICCLSFFDNYFELPKLMLPFWFLVSYLFAIERKIIMSTMQKFA